ncbi:tRNA (adenosine(37)-N6)-threonylcarbamoyltransferase complex ATPase subunit type 1 TsaE [Desulfococcaceae bacterium HSG9]|nr:tRNA (adenosine(37)-N6)-threonylcarbamoyltransferase complex ATPase subunit type 1 TsaE [Desulfococcaceae bacterium HSG9]
MTNALQINTSSSDATYSLGRQIGRCLQTGMIIALCGDLGAGKTVFVQGLGAGLEVPSQYYITSPTYTLINEYPGRLPLFHVDLYRLDNVNNIDVNDLDANIGLYDIFNAKGIVAIEWAERCLQSLADDYLKIEISIIDDEKRTFILTSYGDMSANVLRQISHKNGQE